MNNYINELYSIEDFNAEYGDILRSKTGPEYIQLVKILDNMRSYNEAAIRCSLGIIYAEMLKFKYCHNHPSVLFSKSKISSMKMVLESYIDSEDDNDKKIVSEIITNELISKIYEKAKILVSSNMNIPISTFPETSSEFDSYIFTNSNVLSVYSFMRENASNPYIMYDLCMINDPDIKYHINSEDYIVNEYYKYRYGNDFSLLYGSPELHIVHSIANIWKFLLHQTVTDYFTSSYQAMWAEYEYYKIYFLLDTKNINRFFLTGDFQGKLYDIVKDIVEARGIECPKYLPLNWQLPEPSLFNDTKIIIPSLNDIDLANDRYDFRTDWNTINIVEFIELYETEIRRKIDIEDDTFISKLDTILYDKLSSTSDNVNNNYCDLMGDLLYITIDDIDSSKTIDKVDLIDRIRYKSLANKIDVLLFKEKVMRFDNYIEKYEKIINSKNIEKLLENSGVAKYNDEIDLLDILL